MTEPRDYRDTVFLPKTDFPMKAGLPQKEPGILARWQQEKLYEELLIGDNVNPTDHPMIMRANEEHLSWEAFKVVLEQLLAC